MLRAFAIALVSFIMATGCETPTIERSFFREDIMTRNQRLTTYPMLEQWKIFLYGNQIIHPPVTGLAEPLAQQGEPMLRFILKELESSRNDLDYRDSLVVFWLMQQHGIYPVCNDEEVMQKITANQWRIRDSGWRQIYIETLGGICE